MPNNDGDVVPGRPVLVDERGRPIKKDDVEVALATQADLRAYADANRQLGQMQVPALVSSDRPNERLFVAVLDGTGNDMNDVSKGARTGVAQIHQEIQQQRAGGVTNVASGYVTGPGTKSYGNWDAATGHTFEERAEYMYRQFTEQSARWLKENPNADIRVAAIGFSRGAEEAAYFTRIVDERGIQDPSGAKYKFTHDGLITSVEYTKPPLVEPGQVKQAALLEDPVATGDPRNYDRRLPPSVVSALQITARDETRDQFVGTPHLPAGFSDNNRSLNITVPGAHSDIGDGYFANGLGTRNTNIAKQYLNGLVDNPTPLLTLRPEAQGLTAQSSNVIHDSERHNSWIYTRMGFDRDGVRDVNTQLGATRYEYQGGPHGGAMVPAVPTAEERRREPVDPKLTQGLEYRALPIAPAPGTPAPNRAELQPNNGAPPTVVEPGHPGNQIYRQALQGIEKSPNIPPNSLDEGQRSRVAAALTATAVEGPDPLRKIDVVLYNRKADGVIAMEGGVNDPTQKLKSVPLDQAMNTPVQESSKRVEVALDENARAQRTPTPQQDVPTVAAPSR
ncbi:MAG: DUF2235 domain-containing protein [Lysobacter sp.]|nr:DUF2235 domain-containing protein [Lysobacter sp.]